MPDTDPITAYQKRLYLLASRSDSIETDCQRLLDILPGLGGSLRALAGAITHRGPLDPVRGDLHKGECYPPETHAFEALHALLDARECIDTLNRQMQFIDEHWHETGIRVEFAPGLELEPRAAK